MVADAGSQREVQYGTGGIVKVVTALMRSFKSDMEHKKGFYSETRHPFLYLWQMCPADTDCDGTDDLLRIGNVINVRSVSCSCMLRYRNR